MTAACREAGLPEPQFTELGSGFHVTFRQERRAAPVVDELNTEILKLRN